MGQDGGLYESAERRSHPGSGMKTEWWPMSGLAWSCGWAGWVGGACGEKGRQDRSRRNVLVRGQVAWAPLQGFLRWGPNGREELGSPGVSPCAWGCPAVSLLHFLFSLGL